MNYRKKSNLVRRFLAGLVDYTIILSFTFLLTLFGEIDASGLEYFISLPWLIIILCWLFWTVGMEFYFGGTIGNKLFHLKVLSLDQHKKTITLKQSFVRHLFDIVDLITLGITGIYFITKTEQNQRIGDIQAKTIVINILDK